MLIHWHLSGIHGNKESWEAQDGQLVLMCCFCEENEARRGPDGHPEASAVGMEVALGNSRIADLGHTECGCPPVLFSCLALTPHITGRKEPRKRSMYFAPVVKKIFFFAATDWGNEYLEKGPGSLSVLLSPTLKHFNISSSTHCRSVEIKTLLSHSE